MVNKQKTVTLHEKDEVNEAFKEILGQGLFRLAVYNPRTRLACPFHGYQEKILSRMKNLDDQTARAEGQNKKTLHDHKRMIAPESVDKIVVELNYNLTFSLYILYELLLDRQDVKAELKDALAMAVNEGLKALKFSGTGKEKTG